MIISHIKLRRTLTFNKYLSNVVSLIFLSKVLHWNKMAFPASNLLKLAGIVANDLKKNISKINTKINIHFLYPIYIMRYVKVKLEK